ncbi:probable glucoamylase and related glycosyl hydrolases [Fusarium oxysporum]|uniref:Probable glucoamylase and related glycosyl hydrolases n=1 Tax=Fusarium oxysporum TaxID=5507 RepID=A0A2H3UFE0_FUSOX|nr:probable glucoamylase and related glycosyl hydrolases [Fusarium oxysporum]
MAGPSEADVSAGYCPIEDYGLIGDMHTCALVNKFGSIDFMCWPVFDSPSMFCRLLDKDHGGHFSIRTSPEIHAINKQKYLPYTNILNTKWLYEGGAADVLDYFPVDRSARAAKRDDLALLAWCSCEDPATDHGQPSECQSGIIRKISCSRGEIDMDIEIIPAFNYARDEHRVIDWPNTRIHGAGTHTVTFGTENGGLQVDIHLEADEGNNEGPIMDFQLHDREGLGGLGVYAKLKIAARQTVTLIAHSNRIRMPRDNLGSYLKGLERKTLEFWSGWTKRCTFRGHYREQVERSLLILKLLTYQPTGAIIAAPTFSLPESIGGGRNWDYRYSWIRDTSFVLYVFLEKGYSEEATAYMSFVYNRIIPSISCKLVASSKKQLFPIVLTIRGETEIREIELPHFDGYRGSRPVRIGNGATSHTQLDIFGALLDSIYLYNKFAGPISYDQWCDIRRIVDHIASRLCDEPDMSIWEVRGEKKNFIFSKIMLWVALDRAVRLADKRSNLPCPNRSMWLSTRNRLYEEIMEKGYNSKGRFFCMSYENRDVLDASVLIAPLVLFIAPDDPRFLSTLDRIMQPPEDGGLMSANMVFRYDHNKVHDGMDSEEGKFIMVTFWLIEAMSRASRAKVYPREHPRLIELHNKASTYFDNVLSFANHLGIFSEEVNVSGEQVGNTPQAFSHLACISAAMNLAKE